MKKKITKLFFGCLLTASSLIANAQVDMQFTADADIATGWNYTASAGSIYSSQYFGVSRTSTNTYATTYYQPAGGISFGTHRFIAVKSTNSSVSLKLTSNVAGSAEATCAYSILVSPVPGTRFYVHLFRLADFTVASGVSNLTPAGSLTCTKMSISTSGGTPGISATYPVVYYDWVKTFDTEAAMVQFAADNSKFDIDFKQADAINNNLNLWVSNATTVNDVPTLSADNEYLEFTPKAGATGLPAQTSVRYNAATPFYWDMSASKVVVMRINSTKIPQLGIYAASLLPSGSYNVAGFAPESNPQTVPNSTDKLYVFNLANGSLTSISGVQQFNLFKINAPLQNIGDVAKVDFIKTFADLATANAFVASYNNPLAVNNIAFPKADFIVYTSSGDIHIEGMSTSSLVEVFNLNGAKVFAKELNNGTIHSLSSGVYIVKIKNSVVKVSL